jgi:hypothetical protein
MKMSKEQRLSQLLAQRDTVKSTTNPQFTELQKAVKVPALFQGQAKTYEKKAEDGDDQPAQNVRVQKRVADILSDMKKLCVQQFDAVASVDVGNQVAKADVVVNGTTLLTGVPVVTLLTLEKDLKQVRSVLSDLPTLDPAFDWKKDEAASLFKTSEIRTNRTAKIQKPIVLAPATEKHPAQTNLITVDETVGQWVTVNVSGAVPLDEKKKLVERCDVLIAAVQSAREEANSAKVTPVAVGAPIFDFLLG